MVFTIIVTVVIFVVAFLLAYSGIPFVVGVAHKLKLFDLPNSRKVHQQPVPRLGGVAFLPVVIVVLCVFSVFILRISLKNIHLWTSTMVQHFLAYLAGVILLYAVGVYDDLIGVGYKVKFGFQIAAACLLCVSGLWIATFDNVFFLERIPFWVGMPITIFFAVYVTNAINLIDGIDGLASGLAIISLSVLTAVNFLAHSLFWSFASLSWLAAVCAFFFYNVYSKKNKVFMGDAGSLTLGFTLAFMILRFWQAEPVECHYIEKPNLLAISTLIVPLFDVVRVFASRLRDGRSPFLPDKNHIHHKLLRTGMKNAQVRITLLLIATSFIAINYFLSLYVNETLVVVVDVVAYVVLQYSINYFIAKRERPGNIEYDRTLS